MRDILKGGRETHSAVLMWLDGIKITTEDYVVKIQLGLLGREGKNRTGTGGLASGSNYNDRLIQLLFIEGSTFLDGWHHFLPIYPKQYIFFVFTRTDQHKVPKNECINCLPNVTGLQQYMWNSQSVKCWFAGCGSLLKKQLMSF